MDDTEFTRICKVHLDTFRLFFETNFHGNGPNSIIAYCYVKKAIETLEDTDEELEELLRKVNN